MAEPIIRVEGLKWKYEGSRDWVLKGVDLEIHQGEFVGIVGPNDSGKTTLAMSLNGLVPNNYPGVMEGRVVVDGMDTREHSVAEIAESVGFVFPDPESQFLSMTVEEEVVFALENRGLPREEIEERMWWALELTNIPEDYLEKPPYELSGGEKQRVAIASVLAMRPKIIVLDEPTSMLDPIGKTEVIEVLTEMKRRYNATVIVIEHRLEDIAPLADKMVLVYRGTIPKVAPPREFFQDVDFLLEHDVFPPDVMVLANELRRRGLYDGPVPMTVDEFQAFVFFF
ncbi:MAG: ATP-binding cassette domain-containing protein, partial [Candidatus Korarchaeota archaeon]|nr:ATP-binding cassette domain-containing protein [Candidatus Korarchaeota archaeon]